MAKRFISTDVYRHFGAYERLRRAILEEPDHERMDRTLAYWVLPADRRLPVAFLDRKLRDILSHSLEELLQTPGIGEKKVSGLLTLLRRALRSGSGNEADFGLERVGDRRRRASAPVAFDPTLVSEELWSQWRESVRAHGFGEYTLGQLAPTLQSLPTVIWNAKLSDYLDLTLDEIRKLRTHGEKRIHAILEVFSCIHEAIASSNVPEHLEISLKQKRMANVTRWILQTLEMDRPPNANAIYQHLATPLLRQVEIDLGKQIAKVAESRIERNANAPSVRDHAKKLNVTRARVYQLLEECAKAIQVRWPEGRWLLIPLASQIALEQDVETMEQFRSIRELFFPKVFTASELENSVA